MIRRIDLDARAPLPRSTNLTMLAYQVMPLAPARAVNRETARIIAAVAELPPPAVIVSETPKRREQPAGSSTRSRRRMSAEEKAAAKAEQARKQSETRLRNCSEEVRKLFAAGPLTVNQVKAAQGYKSRVAAGVMVNVWARRGLLKQTGEYFCDPAQAGMRGGSRKQVLWGLT